MTKTDKQKLDVFLCHASADKPRVKSLYRKLLRERNIEPWLDKEKLLPGQNWDLEIRKAVSKTDVILVCLSKQSISKEGYVQKEINLALDVADEKPEGKIFLIPLKLEECEVPARLSSWHWLNYFEEKAYERLLQSLQTRADDFGIKIGNEKSESKLAPTLSKPSIKSRETKLEVTKSLRGSGSASDHPTEQDFQITREKGIHLANDLERVIQQYQLSSGILFNKPGTSRFTVDADIEVNAIWALAQFFNKSVTVISPAHLIEVAENVLGAGLPESNLTDGYKLSQLLLALRTSPGIPDKLINDLWQLIREYYISTTPNGSPFLISNPDRPHSLSWANVYLMLALTLGPENRAPEGAVEFAKKIERSVNNYLAKGEGIVRAHWFDQPKTDLVGEIKAFGNSLYGVGLIALAQATYIADYERRSVASVDTIANLLSKTLWDSRVDMPSRSQNENTRRVRALSTVLFFTSEFLSYKLREGHSSSAGPVFSDPKLTLVWNRMRRLLTIHSELVKSDARGLPVTISDSLEARGDYEGLTQAYAYLAAASVSNLCSSIILSK